MSSKNATGMAILLTIILATITILFVPIPFMPKENCQERIEEYYVLSCCENVSDVDGDGFVLLHENGLGYGDFATRNWDRCHCSGYHSDRTAFICGKKIYELFI